MNNSGDRIDVRCKREEVRWLMSDGWFMVHGSWCMVHECSMKKPPTPLRSERSHRYFYNVTQKAAIK